jgi:hypothetical protein
MERVLRETARGPKLAYTLDEAVASISIGRTSLYADHAAGLIEMRKRGSRTIILADELRRYLAALPVVGTTGRPSLS